MVIFLLLLVSRLAVPGVCVRFILGVGGDVMSSFGAFRRDVWLSDVDGLCGFYMEQACGSSGATAASDWMAPTVYGRFEEGAIRQDLWRA